MALENSEYSDNDKYSFEEREQIRQKSWAAIEQSIKDHEEMHLAKQEEIRYKRQCIEEDKQFRQEQEALRSQELNFKKEQLLLTGEHLKKNTITLARELEDLQITWEDLDRQFLIAREKLGV